MEIGKFYDDLLREEKIKIEIRKLNKVIKNLPKEKKILCKPLIDNIAFNVIQTEELRELIKRDGYYETYQNGENQTGIKKSVASDLLVQIQKNYSMLLGRLEEIIPDGTSGGDALEQFIRENKLS